MPCTIELETFDKLEVTLSDQTAQDNLDKENLDLSVELTPSTSNGWIPREYFRARDTFQ